MNTVRLNDVWRNVNSEIGFHTIETFKKIPSCPGVYAWFYPLRILDYNLENFIKEVNLVLNYDCETKGPPTRNHNFYLGWEIIKSTIEIHPKNVDVSHFKDIWDELISTEESFNLFRKIVMKASIFLPPLYVGKTTDLNYRCQQHINGKSKEDNIFHTRFTEYAEKLDLKANKISDLLFVYIKTNDDKEKSKRSEELVEAIIKLMAKPQYSKI